MLQHLGGIAAGDHKSAALVNFYSNYINEIIFSYPFQRIDPILLCIIFTEGNLGYVTEHTNQG